MAIGNTTIVWRSLTARLFSTVTTILLVSVSVGLMLLLLSMRDAALAAFERGIGNMQVLISRDSSPLTSVLDGVFYAGAPPKPIMWGEYEQLTSRFPFEYAIPTQMGDSYRGRPVVATAPEFFTQFQPVKDEPWKFAQGRAFDGSFQLVAGSEAAQATSLRIGDKVSLSHGSPRDPNAHVHADFSYEVVGILAPTGSPHDRALFTDLTSAWILHAHDRRKQTLGEGAKTTADDLIDEDKKITGIYARVLSRPGSAMGSALPQVLSMLRASQSYTVAEPGGEIKKLHEIVGNVDQILLGMAAAVIVSGAIAVMLALYNSMEQRRRQIAVLRVLGASRRRIFLLVVAESAAIGIAGALVGVVIAAVGGEVVSGVMEARLGLVIHPAVTLVPTAIVVGATTVLAAAAGLVPAIAGYRTSVVRNLRPFG